MKKTVLITGGGGFIARHLISRLEEEGSDVKILTRSPEAANEYSWNLKDWTMNGTALDGVTHIVHLSGSKLVDGKPLTEEKKELVYATRIGAANFLRQKLKERGQGLRGFVCASAIGYYGFTDKSLEIDEDGEAGRGFNAQLCIDWEAAADLFKAEGVAQHVSKVRVPFVLGRDGGIFPVYLGMVERDPQAAAHGDVSFMPWTHVTDMAGIFAHALRQDLDGAYNAVAPEPASSQDLLRLIAGHLSGTPAQPTPFKGQHLVSHKIVQAGYQLQFPSMREAVADLMN